MESIRCGQCQKLLAKGTALALEIKCPRCGTINHMRTPSPLTERPRASTHEEAYVSQETPSPTAGR